MSSADDNEDGRKRRETVAPPDDDSLAVATSINFDSAPAATNNKKAKPDDFQQMLEELRREFEVKLEANKREVEAKNREVEANNRELEAKFEAKLDAKFDELIQSKTVKGATTQAQFFQMLLDENNVKFTTDNVRDFLGLKEIIPLPMHIVTPVGLPVNSPEKNVQEEFERCLELIRMDTGAETLLTSTPKEKAYNGPSFAGRKPDLVNHEKGFTGSIAITFFGDCKRRAVSGNFSHEEMGHVLDMARVFMEKVGHYRSKLIIFLTDGTRWQFFKATRTSANRGKLTYDASKIVNDVQEGWNILWTLLQQDVSTLGYNEPKVQDVQLRDPLGRGGSCTVYQGIHNGESVVVKIFRKSKSYSFDAEKFALEQLSGTAGVPKIINTARVSEADKFDSHSEALILTPVAEDLRTDKCRFGHPVDGSHMKSLVQVVQYAHKKNLIHRDIKPTNCFFHKDVGFILNDWGSSRLASAKSDVWEGSIGFSVSPKQQQVNKWDDKACDLVAVVRTAFVLFCKESPPVNSHESADGYWGKKNSCWNGMGAGTEVGAQKGL